MTNSSSNGFLNNIYEIVYNNIIKEEQKATEDSTIATIFGISGSVVAITFFISPVFLFIEANKTKSLEKIPFLLLISNFLNSLLWIMYGFSKRQFSQYLCNLIATGFNLPWLIWYFIINYRQNIN